MVQGHLLLFSMFRVRPLLNGNAGIRILTLTLLFPRSQPPVETSSCIFCQYSEEAL